MNFKNSLYIALVTCLSALSLGSCNLLYDDLQPCPEKEVPRAQINFTFTQNMEFEDQFADKVHCIDLYIFKHGGTIVYQHHQESDNESTRSVDNMHTLELEPGFYDAVVYGGMFCTQSSFQLVYTGDNDLTLNDLEVALDKSYYFDASEETGDPSDHLEDHSTLEIHDHFYGIKENFLVEEEGDTSITIDLERNTNRINVKLFYADNSAIDVNDYRLYIIDDNNSFDTNNDLTESGLIAYRPYSKTNLTENGKPMAEADFTVSKLYKNNKDQFGRITPELVVVDKNTGEYVVDYEDLMPYLLAAKDAYSNATGMSDEEFLRRNYEWNIEVKLGVTKNTWLSIIIKVDDWEVRFDNIEFTD